MVKLFFLESSCGESKLTKMECLGSLAPRFVNTDYVTSEIICSTVHQYQEALGWSQITLCCRDIGAPPRKWWYLRLSHSCVHWANYKRSGYRESTAMAAASA